MKHKKKTFSILSGLAVLVLLSAFTLPSLAATVAKTITVYTGVKVYVNDIPIDPGDTHGNPDAFIYNGTTYVAVSAVSKSLGENVVWDGTTSSVYIGAHEGTRAYLLDVCPPYQTDDHYKTPAYMSMGGKNYTNGFEIAWSSGYAYFNLNGKYDLLEFDAGHIDGGYMTDGILLIYLDGKLADTISLSSSHLVEHHSVNLNGALQMKMEWSDDKDDGLDKIIDFGIANLTVS